MTFFAQLFREIIVVRFQRIDSAKWFALKTSGYLFLARNIMAFASHEYEEIVIFEDLLLAHRSANFQQFVSNRLTELEQN